MLQTDCFRKYFIFTASLLAVLSVFGHAQSVRSATAPAEAALQEQSFKRAVLIPIQKEITEITLDSIERRLNNLEDGDDTLIVLDLDTPGGALGSTLEICHLLKKRREQGSRIYAWVNAEAYSAGAIIALATDGVVMARNGRIGDCRPIMMSGTGPMAVPEELQPKVMSPLMAELRDSARRNGYDMTMMMSLILQDRDVWWVENRDTGERRFVLTDERNQLFGLASTQPASGSQNDRDGRAYDGFVADESSTTSWKYVQDSPELGKPRQPVVGDKELLTMTTAEALAYGFAIARVDNEQELAALFNVSGPVESLSLTWMERFVVWLTSPIVRGVLFLLMMLGAYAEFQSPGFGLPGAIALTALVLFLGAPYMAGFTATWEIIAIVLGLILIGVEIIVLPGMGVAGLVGILLLMIGLIASFVPAEPAPPNGPDWFQWPDLPQTYDYLQRGLIVVSAGMVASLIGMVLIARYFPRLPIATRLILPNPQRVAIEVEDPYGGVADLGAVGTAASLLRPAGKARFGDRLVDVVSQGDYIEPGAAIQVCERCGNRVVVRRVESK